VNDTLRTLLKSKGRTVHTVSPEATVLDAVRQWVFTPTLLNGVPVPVIMTVTVNFTLQ